MLAGISSFGMSGVNAHGIFARSQGGSQQVWSPQQLLWQHHRHWVVPVRYQELQTFQSLQSADDTCRYGCYFAISFVRGPCRSYAGCIESNQNVAVHDGRFNHRLPSYKPIGQVQ